MISEADWKWAQEALDAQDIKPKERTMNEEATNTAAEANAPATAQLTDEQIEAILASKPESAPVAVAEDDKAEEPTVH